MTTLHFPLQDGNEKVLVLFESFKTPFEKMYLWRNQGYLLIVCTTQKEFQTVQEAYSPDRSVPIPHTPEQN